MTLREVLIHHQSKVIAWHGDEVGNMNGRAISKITFTGMVVLTTLLLSANCVGRDVNSPVKISYLVDSDKTIAVFRGAIDQFAKGRGFRLVPSLDGDKLLADRGEFVDDYNGSEGVEFSVSNVTHKNCLVVALPGEGGLRLNFTKEELDQYLHGQVKNLGKAYQNSICGKGENIM